MTRNELHNYMNMCSWTIIDVLRCVETYIVEVIAKPAHGRNMCIYVCIYIYVYICPCMCVYIYIYIGVYVYICIITHTYNIISYIYIYNVIHNMYEPGAFQMGMHAPVPLALDNI